MINSKILLLLFLFSVTAQHTLPVVECRRTNTPINIDGVLDEAAWQKAQKLTLKNNRSGDDIKNADYITHAMTCYDTDSLYIAFVNRDRDIWSTYQKRDDFLWKQEVVEVFIDTDAQLSTYIELEVSPLNVVFDSFITDTMNIDLVKTPQFDLQGWRTAVTVNGTVNDHSDRDRYWIVEMALPFTELDADFDHTKLSSYQWKINFYRINRDDNSPESYAWSATYRRFHTPSRFGTIVFR